MPTERAYYNEFRQRLIAARKRLEWTQLQMATALGIELENYKKYERRSKFPLHLIEQLALVTHSDIDFVVTGRNVKPFPQRTARASRA
jgi:transcriptional regulator with XRE-family HTH domain